MDMSLANVKWRALQSSNQRGLWRYYWFSQLARYIRWGLSGMQSFWKFMVGSLFKKRLMVLLLHQSFFERWISSITQSSTCVCEFVCVCVPEYTTLENVSRYELLRSKSTGWGVRGTVSLFNFYKILLIRV